MQNIMEHAGRVVNVVGNTIDVEMSVEGACSSCKAKAACGMSETANKNVSVYAEDASLYSVGDNVIVSITQFMGVKAVVYSYILPFFVILATLLAMVSVQDNEAVSGGSALAAGALYYLVLFLFRKRVAKEIVFEIRKDN